MAFDQLWEQTHNTRYWGQYPNEQFTFFMRRRGPDSREERKIFQVLDIGCGQGSNTWFLAREGYAVTALDGSPSALFRLANRLKDENLGASLVRADLHQPLVQFPDNGFDVVCDVQASCYGTVDQVAATIKEMHRILKPGGSIFCNMPAAGCDNEHFTKHGVCHMATAEDISIFFWDFRSYACMKTTCVDCHKNPDMKPFLEFWTIEANKADA